MSLHRLVFSVVKGYSVVGCNCVVRTLTKGMKWIQTLLALLSVVATSTPKIVSNCLVPQTVACNLHKTCLLTGYSHYQICQTISNGIVFLWFHTPLNRSSCFYILFISKEQCHKLCLQNHHLNRPHLTMKWYTPYLLGSWHMYNESKNESHYTVWSSI